MIKKILILLVFALSVGAFSAYAQFGGGPGTGDGNGGNGGGENPEDPISLQGLLQQCAFQPSTQDKRICLAYGFSYQINEHLLYTALNEEMRFKSEIVKLHETTVKESHYDVTITCNDCESGNSQRDYERLGGRMVSGMVSAVFNSGFQTQSLSVNGRTMSSTAPAVSNDGGLVSGVFKDIAKNVGSSVLTDKVKDFLNNEDPDIEFSFFLHVDERGRPIVILKPRKNGTLVTVVSFNSDNTITDSRGNTTSRFEATMSSFAEAQAFERIVRGALQTSFQNIGGGSGVRCFLTFTGPSDMLVAQVVCG